MNHIADRPRTKPAANPPMFALIGLAHALEARLEAALEAANLSLAKLAVLKQLAEAREAIPLSELAKGMRCVRSNMTQLIDRLEKEGLVRRVDHPNDRRSVRASLTASGREHEAEGSRIVQRMQADFAASLSVDDRVALERVLAALR